MIQSYMYVVRNHNPAGVQCWENSAVFYISQPEDTKTNIYSLWKETERNRHVAKEPWGWNRSWWAVNQTEPSPLACHSLETRVTQPGSSLVVWCVESDLIKMCEPIMKHWVTANNRTKSPVFSLTSKQLLYSFHKIIFDWLDFETICFRKHDLNCFF